MAFPQQTSEREHDPTSKDIGDIKSNDNDGNMEQLRSFAQDTTLHGARFLCADNIFRRLLWSVAVTVCFGHCCYQVFTCVSEFNKRPFNTKITVNTSKDNGVSFPAVTLCNLNSLNTRRFVDIMSVHENRSIIERKLRDITLLTRRSKEISSQGFQNRNPDLFRRQRTADNTKQLQELFSHQIEEMFLPGSPDFESCSFNGKPCDVKNFTSYKSFMFGKCYTFNSVEGDNPPLQETMAGQHTGLKLRLNIEREGYLKSTLNPFVGLVILIHDHKAFPIMEEFGIKVQPGVSTLCAIKKRKIINLPNPYATNCTKRSLAVFNSNAYTAYTKAACLLNCRNEYTIKTCACTPVEFKADPSVPICAPNDTVLCVYRSYEDFGSSHKKSECEKDCPEPCEYEEYKTSFSFSGLQRDVLIEHLMSWLNSTEKLSVDRAIYEPLLDMNRAEREKYIHDNIVSLDIYFEDLSYDVIEQTPLYETWALIGNLGGTFGFFLGMSLITALEFLDFTFRRIWNLFQPKRNTRVTTMENSGP